jgi:hypothetical protein
LSSSSRHADRTTSFGVSWPADPPPRALYHPYGALSRLWESLVLLGLVVVMPTVYRSLAEIAATGAPPESERRVAMWLAYCAIQVASKLPVSFRYPHTGWRAALELGGFAALLLGALAFVLGHANALTVGGWRLALGVAVVGLGAFYAWPMDSDDGPVPFGRQLLAKAVGTLVYAPMIAVLVILAGGAPGR